MEVNFFQILLIWCYISSLACLKSGTLCGNKKLKTRIYSGPALKGLIAPDILFSHSVLWFSLWDVYRYQPISHSSCRLSNVWLEVSCVSRSCEKIQTVFIFRAICENTAHVQWIRCSPKGSHLIHWTSAVFSHAALKWTTFAYLMTLPHLAW